MLVVGAGIAGASVAFALARRGVEVLVVERGRIGVQGASSLPAALLNPHRGRTGRATPLDRAGLAEFWQVVGALERADLASGAHRSGVLRIATGARQARAWQALDGPTWLEPGDLPAAYRAPHGAMLVPDGGWVEPAQLLHALTRSARAHGARLLERREVVRVTCRDDAIEAVLRDPDGGNERRVRAAHLVLAAGADEVAGVRLPRLERAAGAALVLALPAPHGAAPALPYPIAGAVNAAFDGAVAMVNGGHVAPHDLDPDALRQALARFVPDATEGQVLASWTGVRVRRASGVPVVRRLHPHLTLFGAMAGRGFLTAGYLAGRLAERLAKRLGRP